MAKIKKNLSLEENILNKGLERAKELGYNFSAYITYLINKDISNEIIESNNDEAQVEEINIDNDILDEIDNITTNF